MPLLQRVAEQGSVSMIAHGLMSDDIIHVPEAHTEHKKQTTAAYRVIPHIIGVSFRCPTDNTLQHGLQDAVMNCWYVPLTRVYRALLGMRMLLCGGARQPNIQGLSKISEPQTFLLQHLPQIDEWRLASSVPIVQGMTRFLEMINLSSSFRTISPDGSEGQVRVMQKH
jgi:hypothetical protein